MANVKKNISKKELLIALMANPDWNARQLVEHFIPDLADVEKEIKVASMKRRLSRMINSAQLKKQYEVNPKERPYRSNYIIAVKLNRALLQLSRISENNPHYWRRLLLQDSKKNRRQEKTDDKPEEPLDRILEPLDLADEIVKKHKTSEVYKLIVHDAWAVMGGTWDIFFLVSAADEVGVGRFVTQELFKIPGIQDTMTMIIVHRHRHEHWLTFTQEDDEH